MKKINNIPQYLGITGQSGSGKGSTIKLICEMYEENNISYELISNGSLFRKESEEETFFGKKMKGINNEGLPQPLIVSIGTYYPKIKEALNAGKHIIHDGSPRQIGEAKEMSGLLRVGYCESMSIIEVIASEEKCRKRLFERTEIDKRLDLSVNGHPGFPDLNKITSKMNWWSKYRNQIVLEIKSTQQVYIPLKNEGVLNDLKESLQSCFFH